MVSYYGDTKQNKLNKYKWYKKEQYEYSALDISTGPAHFSDRRTSSGQYILSVTGPYGPPRYMSGHQISNSAGPNDDNSVCIFRAVARPTSRQLSRSPFATARRQRVASPSLACQPNTLTSVFRSRGTSTRTSGTHPGTFLREAHVMVPSKQFCVLVG